MYISEIPDIFKSEDTIYHYTTLKSATEFILYDNNLRLSRRKNSNDPIEKILPSINFSEYGYSDEILPDSSNERDNISDLIRRKLKQAKQLCFCMNDNKSRKINSNPEFPHEYFGFMKPRMWDQYADKYNGVCLAFSLTELRKEANGMLNRKVDYVNYNTLRQQSVSVDMNEIKKNGLDRYWNERFSSNIDDIIFRKHIDYEGENEYRFVSYSNNEFDNISIKNSLRGIIVSDNYSSNFSKEIVNKYADNYKIEMLFLSWIPEGINFQTKHSRDNVSAMLKNMVDKNFQ